MRAFRAIYVLVLLIAMPLRSQSIDWDDALGQPDDFYATAEAMRIAEQVLLYQRADGGWPKNTNFARPLTDAEKVELEKKKSTITESTIDNGATFTPMRFMARVYSASKKEGYRESFMHGLNFLLKAQYDNGGWPQFPNRRSGYHLHITYNDNAMIGVMSLLRDVAGQKDEVSFVPAQLRQDCEAAIAKGIECILKTQVRVDGKLTAWCAQHDEKTLAPAEARSYEKISLSGHETVGIVRFLMGIENPSPQIKESIGAAVAWLEAVKIQGVRVEQRPNPDLGLERDRVVVNDPNAPALWARFYEIGTNRPIFCGRDGMVKYSLAEIEAERRNGYSWYGEYAASLLAKDYPKWRDRIARIKAE